MKKLTSWLAHQAKRSEDFLSIADLLFLNKTTAYIYFRLRYFNWLVLIRLVFHIVIFLALHEAFPAGNLGMIVGVWALSFIINSAWWGALEVLRTRIRDYHSTKQHDALQQELNHWLWLGLWGSILLALLGLSCGLYAFSSSQQALVWVFAGSLLLSTGIRFGFEPYHSSIYAVSRILRPLWSLVIGEVVSFMVIMIGWHILNYWILPIVILLTAIINTGLRYYYCRRMLEFYEWQVNFKTLTVRRWLANLPKRNLLLAALAMIFIQIEGPILLMSVKFQQSHTLYYQLFSVLFLTMPLINASSEWAQLFYFDWKKLKRFNFQALHQRYDKAILYLSPIVGILLGLLAAVSSYLLLTDILPTVYSIAILLISLRAIIAYLQIRAFAQFYYWDIIVSGVMLLGSTRIACINVPAPGYSLAAIGLGLGLAMAWMLKPRSTQVDRISRFKLQVTFYDWLTQVQQLADNVQLGLIRLAPETSYYKILRIVDWLGQTYLHKNGKLCVIGNKIIFYRVYTNTAKPIELKQLAISTGGLVQALELSPCTQANGQQFNVCLAAFLKQKVQVVVIRPTKLSHKEADYAGFFSSFPDGLIFTPNCRLGPLAEMPSKMHIHSLLYQTEIFLTAQEQGVFPYEVAVSYDKGTISAIYAIPRSNYSRRVLQAWRNAINSANIQRVLDI